MAIIIHRDETGYSIQYDGADAEELMRFFDADADGSVTRPLPYTAGADPATVLRNTRNTMGTTRVVLDAELERTIVPETR